MADGRKLILGIGDAHNIKNFEENFRIMGENRIVFGGRAGSVTEAMNEINSGDYWGVLMSSLVLRNGVEAEKYNIAAKKFEEFDNSPYIFRSGGLYVVEQACNRGLVTVVNAIAEEPNVLVKAGQLGAKCFGNGMKFCDYSVQNLEYFQSHL